jgi:hypothetical protein
MKASGASRGLWARRLGWMVLIWAASVVGLAVVASILRILMSLGGLTA